MLTSLWKNQEGFMESGALESSLKVRKISEWFGKDVDVG